jgi:PAS domain S-box-containing protein
MEVYLVTEDKERQLRLQARLLDAVGQSVIATDLEGKVIYWNKAAEELYGWSAGEALGRILRDMTVPDKLLARAEEIESELRAGRTSSTEMLLRRKDGSHVPVFGTATPIFDERGNLEGMIGVSADISERKAIEAELERQASHDPLTKLPNRHAFVERLEYALRRTGRKEDSPRVGVLFMDLDGFKTVNDSLGHEAGDRLLVAFAERIKNLLRSFWGGRVRRAAGKGGGPLGGDPGGAQDRRGSSGTDQRERLSGERQHQHRHRPGRC